MINKLQLRIFSKYLLRKISKYQRFKLSIEISHHIRRFKKNNRTFMTKLIYTFIAGTLIATLLLPGCQPKSSPKDDVIVKGKREVNGDTVYIIRKDKKEGVIDSKDQVVVPIEFDEVLDLPFGIMISRGSKSGLYDYSGKILLEPRFEGIYSPYMYTPAKKLIDVEDSVNKSLCLLKDGGLTTLFSYNKNDYRLNCLEHSYFNEVKENEVIFCLYHIARQEILQIYLLNQEDAWIDVSGDKKLRSKVEEYFEGEDGPPEIPAPANN
jgi:hypothetical protein